MNLGIMSERTKLKNPDSQFSEPQTAFSRKSFLRIELLRLVDAKKEKKKPKNRLCDNLEKLILVFCLLQKKCSSFWIFRCWLLMTIL